MQTRPVKYDSDIPINNGVAGSKDVEMCTSSS